MIDVGVALSCQQLACPLAQLVDEFDAIHPAGQLGEHRRLVAPAGAHFEDEIVGLGLEEVSHHRDLSGCEIVLSKPIGNGLLRYA